MISIIFLRFWLFIRQPKCGKLPSGKRLERNKKSHNYKGGQFQNTHYTPTIAEGVSMFAVLREFFF